MNAIIMVQNEYLNLASSIIPYIARISNIVKIFEVGALSSNTINDHYTIYPLNSISDPIEFDSVIVLSDLGDKIEELVKTAYPLDSHYRIISVSELADLLPGGGKLVLLREWLSKDLPKYNKNILEVGDFTYHSTIDIHTERYDGSVKCRIGKFCSIADNLTVLLNAEHITDWNTTYPFRNLLPALGNGCDDDTKGDIVIGNDVWIGLNVTILSGVTIGDGCVIGANSVVTKSVEPYSIVAGNPGRVKKKRFSDERIKKLLDLQWWDWPYDKIYSFLPILQSEQELPE